MAEPTQRQRARPVRMQDVAAAAGVSTTTVSRVLRGIADGIPPATREKVLAAAEALGYRPNVIASGLRRQMSDTIGFVSDVIASTPNAGAMVQGAQDAAWAAGKVLVLVNTGGDPQVEGRAIEAMLQRQVDGLLYATMYHRLVTPPPQLDAAPAVLLDSRTADGRLTSVAPDEVGGARAAVRHLVGLGHTAIGYLNSSADIPAAHERLDGYRAELAECGLDVDPGLVVAAEDEFEPGVRAAHRLLDAPRRPTALFCFNDRVAAGAIRAAHQRGLRVPQDLSVVGFDNQELVALLTDPPLTTLQLPHYEMGQWAVQALLRQIDAAHPGPPEQQRIGCQLIERDSTAAPAGPPS